MAYSDFSLNSVKINFDLTIDESIDLFLKSRRRTFKSARTYSERDYSSVSAIFLSWKVRHFLFTKAIITLKK